MNIEAILRVKGRHVGTTTEDASVWEAVRRMRREGMGALVVSPDGATVTGIVSERGILHAIADQGVGVLDRKVGEVMTRDVFSCARDDSVGAIMAAMTDRRIRHIPVVEEDGRLCGIVSIGDVVKHRLDEIQREAEELREYVTGSR
jgi:CBS domain-containing protein